MKVRIASLLILISLSTGGVLSAARNGTHDACVDALVEARGAAVPKRSAQYREPWNAIRSARARCQALSTPLPMRGESVLLAMLLPEYADARTGIDELRSLAAEFAGRSNAGIVKARVFEELAGRLAATMQAQEAENCLAEALRARRSSFGNRSAEYREGLEVSSRIHAELAANSFDAERHGSLAEIEAREAVDLAEALGGEASPKALDAWMNLAQVLERIGRAVEGEAIRAEYLELWLSVRGTAANPDLAP